MRFAQQWVDFNGHNFADMKMQKPVVGLFQTVQSNSKPVPQGITCDDGTR